MVVSNTRYVCGLLPYYRSFKTEKLIRPDCPISAKIPLVICMMLVEKILCTQRTVSLFEQKSRVAHYIRNTVVLAWKG